MEDQRIATTKRCLDSARIGGQEGRRDSRRRSWRYVPGDGEVKGSCRSVAIRADGLNASHCLAVSVCLFEDGHRKRQHGAKAGYEDELSARRNDKTTYDDLDHCRYALVR